MSNTRNISETPDRWVVVKIDNNLDTPFYKVFATWAGGYLDGDRWKLNSGITSMEYDDDYDLVIIVETDYPDDQEGFHDAIDEVNSLISQDVWGDTDLWVMGFHPFDEDIDVLNGENFEPISEYSYGLVFIQRLSLLQGAADKLEAQGYYDVYKGNTEITRMYEIRRDYYRRFLDEKERNESR